MNIQAIRLHKITQIFETVTALDELSLDVPAGTIFGFLGPNGAGKTTTINILLGLLKPTEGTAKVLGFDTRTQAQEIRSRTGALLETTGLYEDLSAEENLEFYGRVWRFPSEQLAARIEELLVPMGLWERRKERAGSWSRGMKQKLALARVLLHRPDVVLLDEPTAGLDVLSATAIRDDLEALVGTQGTTVFLTTHNMSEAERLCSEVAVIRRGKVVALGRPDELRAKAGKPTLQVLGNGFTQEKMVQLEAHPDVTSVTQTNGHIAIQLAENNDTSHLINWMVSEGVQIEEVRKDSASLEDVFLTLMEEENE